MHLNYGKCCLFLAVFGLLILSQTAAAQKISTGGATFGETFLPKPPKTEIAATEATVPNEAETGANEIAAPKVEDRPPVKDFKYQFTQAAATERKFDFGGAAIDDIERAATDDAEKTPLYVRETAPGKGFNYRGAFTQSLIFLAVQHTYATTQPKTREALKHGAFWRDYAQSVKNLHGWDDGGRFFTNYLAHPMQGAFTGHVYVQNSPQALREQFSMSPKYWQTRLKALLWTTAWSTQFEIGPISQASIGNVGLKGKQTWEDIIVTPTAGTAMLIGEDAIDRYVIKSIERGSSNFYVKVFARMLLNPTRNFSNLLRFRAPWYRDRAVAR